MIEINRPKMKYTADRDNARHGVLTVEPLEKGYGTTLGNAFRRVLLSSLPGAAVSAVKIDGVLHEFCSIPGVVEDVTEIILNLKKLIVRVHQDEPITCRLEVQGPAEATAAHIKVGPEVHIVEPDTHIAHITGDIKLGMDITFKKGRGYWLAEKHKTGNEAIDLILIDSQFSPVVKVKYNVEDARVGQEINYDKLTVEVWTNGSMSPVEAIELSAKFLRSHVELFTNIESAEGAHEVPKPPTKEELVMVSATKEEGVQRSNGDMPIKDLEFSVRSRNCLKKAGIQTLGELAGKRATELLEIKNFGKKSLKEIREKLHQYNLCLIGEESGVITDDGADDEDEVEEEE